MLKQLNELNQKIQILSVNSPHFARYGKVLTDCEFRDMFPISIEAMDLSGPTYIKDIEALHNCDSYQFLKNSVFGEIELQTGLCFGMNDKMNGMEFHKSSEVIIAVTDMILILGDMKDIKSNRWDSSLAECFFIPEGTAIELYGGTLHLAPCRVTTEPFCTIIVLPKGTNSPLLSTGDKKDPLLFMNNKWLICHKDSPAVARGGFIGITGENIQIAV
jgi:Domain of unknown function (DUF4867)